MDGQPVVISKQAEELINGVPTQVVCSAFTDHILVVVTQYGKFGTLVSVTPNMVTNDLGKPNLTTKVLLGSDEIHQDGRLNDERRALYTLKILVRYWP
uniref:Proteasome assembly chaperone 3 n=1 Tax=Pyxicephalus adspersus TaxID=30357 RepID=A0AAV2ZS35_PYXAD|nr:TPA: hypothetical protein GDO54_015288 [Pyxicephalus adspersus]